MHVSLEGSFIKNLAEVTRLGFEALARKVARFRQGAIGSDESESGNFSGSGGGTSSGGGAKLVSEQKQANMPKPTPFGSSGGL